MGFRILSKYKINIKSVEVMGDNRTYDNTICVRAVEALDGMTASFAHLPHSFLESVSNRIINEVEGINRVVQTSQANHGEIRVGVGNE